MKWITVGGIATAFLVTLPLSAQADQHMCWCGDYILDKGGNEHWIQVHGQCDAVVSADACNALCWRDGNGFPYFAWENNCDPNAYPFTKASERHQMRHEVPRNFSPIQQTP
jgi:hypothetical protein